MAHETAQERARRIADSIASNIAVIKTAEAKTAENDTKTYLILGGVMLVVVVLALYFKFRNK